MNRYCLIILLLLSTLRLLANPYYVALNGSNSLSTDINNPGAIEFAFDNAPTGSTVYVKAGNYGALNLQVVNSGTTFIGYTNTPGDLTAANMPDSLDTYLANNYEAVYPTLESNRVTGGIAIRLVSGNSNVTVKNFYIHNYTYACSMVGSDNTFEQILADGFGDVTNSYHGKGFIVYGNNNTIRHSMMINAAAEGITIKGNNNLLEHTKVYCDDDTDHGSTDYYILVSPNTSTKESTGNIVRNCYIERVGNLRHGGHGFCITTFYIHKACATGGGYCYDPKWKDHVAYGNTFENCTSKNVAELTLLRGVGVKENDFNNLVSLENGCLKVVSGARFNRFSNCKIYNTKYYDNPNTTSVTWQAGVAFYGASHGETTDMNVSANGIGAYPFDNSVAAEGNVFTNCLFQNVAAGVLLSSYSDFRDHDGNVVDRVNRKIVKDNVFVNCSFLGSDRDTDVFMHSMRGNSGNKMINCAISGFERFESRLFPTSYTSLAIAWHGIIHADFEYNHCNFFNNGFNDQIPEYGDLNGYGGSFASGWSDTLIGKFISCNTKMPGYVDEANNDYHVEHCPSCGLMDKGLNQQEMTAAGYGDLLTDLEGNPRVQYDAIDIGVYEKGDPCAGVVLTPQDYYVAVGGAQQLSTDINNPGDIVYAFANAPQGATVHIKAGNYGAVNLDVGHSNTSFIGYRVQPEDSYQTAKPKDLAEYEANLSGYAASYPFINKQDRVNGGTGIRSSSKNCVTIKNFLIQNYRTGVSIAGHNNTMENILGDGFGNVNNSYNGNGYVIYGSENEIKDCFLLNAAAEGYTIKGNGNLIEHCQAYCNDSISQYGSTDYYIMIAINSGTSQAKYNTMRDCYIERVGSLAHGGHGFCLVGWYRHKNCASGGGYCYDPQFEDDELSYNTIENSTSTNLGECVLLRGVNTKHNEINNVVSNSRGTLHVTWGASYNKFSNCKIKNTNYRKSATSSSIYFTAGVSFVATPYGDTTDMNVPYHAQSAYPWQQDYTAIGNVFSNCLFEHVAAGILLSSYSEFRDADGNPIDRINRKIIKDNVFVNCTFIGRDEPNDCLFYAMRGTEGNQMINCVITGFETYESRYFPTNNSQPVWEVHGIIPTFNTYNHCNFYNNSFDSQVPANGILPAHGGILTNGFNQTLAGTFIDCNTLDPGFEDPANRDFRLSNCVGCGTVNLGTTLAEMEALGLDAPLADLDGIPRPQGAAYDIGAYERNTKSTLEVSAWLEGPFNPTTNLMQDDLHRLCLVPSVDPYVGTHRLNPDLLNRTGSAALIDWVWLELYDDDNNLALVTSSPGVLMADGQILHSSGRPFYFDQSFPLGYYRLLVRHRNHLPALSDVAGHFDNDGDVAYFDYRLANSYDVGGFGQKQLTGSEWGLFAGDGAADAVGYDINVNDRKVWHDDNGIFLKYHAGDYNMDGDLNGMDNVLINTNFGVYSAVKK